MALPTAALFLSCNLYFTSSDLALFVCLNPKFYEIHTGTNGVVSLLSDAPHAFIYLVSLFSLNNFFFSFLFSADTDTLRGGISPSWWTTVCVCMLFWPCLGCLTCLSCASALLALFTLISCECLKNTSFHRTLWLMRKASLHPPILFPRTYVCVGGNNFCYLFLYAAAAAAATTVALA